MKLMTGYEFVDVPVEIELCPHCKQTRLMRSGARMVCTKDGSKHEHGIRYRRMAEEEPGGKPLKGAAREGVVSGPPGTASAGFSGSLALLTAERIRGRQVSIEIGEVADVGWVAIGIVTAGLEHETGMRFEAHAENPSEAELCLKTKIEAAFA